MWGISLAKLVGTSNADLQLKACDLQATVFPPWFTLGEETKGGGVVQDPII